MASQLDDRQLRIADLIDTGAVVSARNQLAHLPATALDEILQAEIATYFGQHQLAEKTLAEVGNKLRAINEIARFARAEGEWLLATHDFDAAAGRFGAATYLSGLMKSRFGEAWALFGLARVARIRQQYDEAERFIGEATDRLKLRLDDKGTYLQGLMNLNLALVRQCTNQPAEAERLYQLAADQLRRTEGCRFFGLTLVGQATLKRTLGQYSEALPLLDEAIALFRQYELKLDLGQTYTIQGHILMLLRRSDEAEKQLAAAAEICAETNDKAGQSAALTILSELCLRRRLLPKAQQALEQSLVLAKEAESNLQLAAALIVQGRIQLVLKDAQASIELFNGALRLAQGESNRQLQIQCNIYLAEAFHGFQMARGQDCLAEAARLMEDQQEVWLQTEFDTVQAKYHRERVQVTDENKFVIDGNLLPEWEDAKRALETFLLRNALVQADNNLTQAGKLLGISKVHVHTRRKQYGV